MTKFFFIPYILQLLSQGTFFRKIFFYFFRAASVLIAILGLVTCAGLLKVVLNLPAVGVIGGFIFIALIIVAFYAAAHIYWIRAADIRDLPDATFTMIPIYAIMVRTTGEVLASFVAVVSLGGFILFLFAPQQAAGMIPLPMGPLSELMERGGNSFIAAIVVLVGGALYSIILLAVFYLVAEFILALAEIAINTGRTAALLSIGAPSAVPLPVIPVPIVRAPLSTAKVCGACGTENPLAAAFCENCGKPL